MLNTASSLDRSQARLRVASPTAQDLGDNPYIKILAEFLVAAAPPQNRWFRPDHDPEPGPEVVRIFDGATYYTRMSDGHWMPAQDDDDDRVRSPQEREQLGRTWASFAGKIIVDATQPRIGNFKITKPEPGAYIADWQTTNAGELRAMLEQALTELSDRVSAGQLDGVVGTRWTPSDHGPILMICLGDEPYHYPSHPLTE